MRHLLAVWLRREGEVSFRNPRLSVGITVFGVASDEVRGRREVSLVFGEQIV